MLAGLIGVTISVTLFGLRWGCVLEMFVSLINLSHSSSFRGAVVARFLWGMLNGNIGVAKTYITEVLSLWLRLHSENHFV
jgi:hypothetical protein